MSSAASFSLPNTLRGCRRRKSNADMKIVHFMPTLMAAKFPEIIEHAGDPLASEAAPQEQEEIERRVFAYRELCPARTLRAWMKEKSQTRLLGEDDLCQHGLVEDHAGRQRSGVYPGNFLIPCRKGRNPKDPDLLAQPSSWPEGAAFLPPRLLEEVLQLALLL